MTSRQDLIAWINDELKLDIIKIEQCGTGAVYCQLFDNIYRNVNMNNVKFNVHTEDAFRQNFKELQKVFKRNNIDKPFDIEKLVKCKMQDNLEFLQWTRRHWEEHAPRDDYDAVARRRGASATSKAGARRGAPTPSGGPRVARAAGPGTAALQNENATLRETVVGLERERDFYFSKLRDIELLIQQAVEDDPELENQEDGLVKSIQAILYSTEEGFEIPEGEVDDQETF